MLDLSCPESTHDSLQAHVFRLSGIVDILSKRCAAGASLDFRPGKIFAVDTYHTTSAYQQDPSAVDPAGPALLAVSRPMQVGFHLLGGEGMSKLKFAVEPNGTESTGFWKILTTHSSLIFLGARRTHAR